jgi:hypothetical protein
MDRYQALRDEPERLISIQKEAKGTLRLRSSKQIVVRVS